MDAPASLTYKTRNCNCQGGRRVGLLSQPVDPMPAEVDLNRYSGPAWIMDLDRARVTTANAAARTLWHESMQSGGTIDRAMPAFHTLRNLSPEEEVVRLLVLWPGRSTVSLRCACRRLARDSNKVLIVAVDVPSGRTPDAGVPKALQPAGTTIDDRATRATLAHELRTPLSAIVALAEVMRDQRLGSMGNARYLAYASDIHDSARHALSVLGAMLGRDNGEPADPEPKGTDVEETARKCASAMQELANKVAVRLATDFMAKGRRLAVDRRSLTQILLNLLSNALKFTPPNGAVTIATRERLDGAVVLSVTDTGTGMQQTDIDRVLGSEGTPPAIKPANGTGLGLPLVKALAHASGASLDIVSEAGQGTCVSVIYPRERVLVPVPPAS